MRRQLAGLLLAVMCGLNARAVRTETGYEVEDASRQAFTRVYSGIGQQQLVQALQGRRLFRQSWVILPALDQDIAGLGPLYNQLACISCHPKNGRGKPPDHPEQAMRSMLVRLSLPGRNEHGGPLAHPVYGDQLNEQGVPGVPGEGRVKVSYRQKIVALSGGETIVLRVPVYTFADLQYGPLADETQFSPRVAPPVFGLGLLEAVPDRTLLRLAEQGRKQGVNGRPNYVWDTERNGRVIGRFGLKANTASLKQQIAGAFIGDLGITSALYPLQNCSAAQTACGSEQSSASVELTETQLNAVLLYLRLLQVPARRNVGDPDARRGDQLFTAIGCAACHIPTLVTGEFPELPVLSGQTIHPYTDLLLHDMGEGLADGRADFDAGARDWRTPPLWGIGLLERINEHTTLLHDGRARNLTEAVIWHGGEALESRRRFERLAASDRRALIRFLSAL